MEYNLLSFIIGLSILIAGVLLVIFYEPISRNFLSGISSFDRVKLTGVIAILLGFIVLLNLHTLILNFLISIVFKRSSIP